MRHRVRAAPPTSPLHRACVLQVLAWGNSIGDFIADTALARAGNPMMGAAGCFGGPLFNLCVGTGVALLVSTSRQPGGVLCLPWDKQVPLRHRLPRRRRALGMHPVSTCIPVATCIPVSTCIPVCILSRAWHVHGMQVPLGIAFLVGAQAISLLVPPCRGFRLTRRYGLARARYHVLSHLLPAFLCLLSPLLCLLSPSRRYGLALVLYYGAFITCSLLLEVTETPQFDAWLRTWYRVADGCPAPARL